MRRCTTGWIACALLLAACGAGSDAGSSGTDVVGFELPFGKPPNKDASTTDQTGTGDAPKDVPLADTATVGVDTGTPKDPPDAVSTDSLAVPQPTCESAGGAFCPCKDNADCDSALCVTTQDGLLCAAKCVTDCEPGFVCKALQLGGDLATVCVPKFGVICNPCGASSDCATPGLSGAACVDHGNKGRFCGTACTQDEDCPAGYVCGAATSVEGIESSQCQTDSGECSCSVYAISLQLGTPCFSGVLDAGGKVVGECKGARECGPDGLTACTAIAKSEVCNGEDDDCDGVTDDAACDDGTPCTADVCDPKAGACAHPNAPGSCDADGNACTEGDACTEGKCLPGPAKDCDDDNPCTLDTCDPGSGCVHAGDDGKACSDGNACTLGDLCAVGLCKAGTPTDCGLDDMCNVVGCDPTSGACFKKTKENGSLCDDASACTKDDACKEGVCGGAPVDCDDANPCTLDACGAGSGCVHTPNNQPCDDGNACTEGDVCEGGTCVGAPGEVSAACDDGNPCTTEGCDAVVGCVNANNAIACDDGNACTAGDECKDGACVPGTSTCQCQTDEDCKPFEDADLCNGTLYCDKAGTKPECVTNPATVKVCSTAGDTPCAKATCEPGSGTCGPVSVPDGKACDADGSVCTTGDACKSGVCEAGAPLLCDDGNPCTDDACDKTAGCSHAPNTAGCNADDNACTTGDVCSSGVCVAGKQKACDDGKPCTTETCDPKTGSCVFDPVPKEGQACDADKDLCTSPDLCKSGACVAGPLVGCDDGNACTTDTCQPATGCLHTGIADGTPCGTNQWCLASKCVAKAFCGDGGLNQASEECDDGNNVSGDGCTADCKKEGPKPPQPGQLVISEIMLDPNGDEVTNLTEWFEIYNPMPFAILVTGLLIKDNVGQEYIAVQGLQIAAGGYFVFGTSNKAAGGSVGYVYDYKASNIALANNADEVSVWSNGQLIDKVAYGTSAGTGWKGPKTGSAYQLGSAALDATNNDIGTNWCFATAGYGSSGDFGTPGGANKTCP